MKKCPQIELLFWEVVLGALPWPSIVLEKDMMFLSGLESKKL